VSNLHDADEMLGLYLEAVMEGRWAAAAFLYEYLTPVDLRGFMTASEDAQEASGSIEAS